MAEKLVAGVETVKKAVQAIVVPGLNDLKTEVRVIGTKVEEIDKRLNEKIDASSLRIEQKIDSDLQRLEQKVDSNSRSLGEKMDGLAEKIDIIKTVTRLEMRVQELEKRK
ncbi:MAG: hypothetical protein OK455_07340 [Thaumarchaeota archaeon]|nr:hypothetical protein [Nitrososphaerota archaeon]